MDISNDHIDRNTVNAFKSGSFEAFDKIYRVYFQKLANYIFQLSKDAVLTEDIVQETFMVLWNKRIQIKEDLNFEGYLFTIARNQYLQNFRSKTKERAFFVELESEVLQEVHSTDNKIELLKKVRKIIEELSPKCKEAFVASKFENLTYAEIADRMGISKKTVEIHISKAYNILRNRLKVMNFFFF